MTELLKILPGENKYINVTWQVNDWCNFRCSYCNEGNWGGNNLNKDIDNIMARTILIYFEELDSRYSEKISMI